MSLGSGTRLGPFEIRERIDLPGFGEVYAARDHDSHRDVAIHVLRTNAAQDEEVRDRFERDVRAAAARIQTDPLTIHLVGVDPQTIYVVSEPIRLSASAKASAPLASQVPFIAVPPPQVADVIQHDLRAPKRAWMAAAVAAIALIAVVMFLIVGDEELAEQDPPELTELRDYVVAPSRHRTRARISSPSSWQVASARGSWASSGQAAPVRSVRPPAAAKPFVPARDARGTTTPLTEATVRATEFDLAGALDLLTVAAAQGDAYARVAVLYVRGLIAARDAFREGGETTALAPVQESIMALGAISMGRPGAAEIARLVLQAAAAASQSEREEMRLYLESAVQMESLQLAAGQGGAPIVPAAEIAGDLWLQVHRYEDARRAYSEGERRVGLTPRILSGLARTARRLNDTPAACAEYRRLVDGWGSRPAVPVEIAEARAYLGGCAR
jgi:hypothetical protein